MAELLTTAEVPLAFQAPSKLHQRHAVSTIKLVKPGDNVTTRAPLSALPRDRATWNGTRPAPNWKLTSMILSEQRTHMWAQWLRWFLLPRPSAVIHSTRRILFLFNRHRRQSRSIAKSRQWRPR